MITKKSLQNLNGLLMLSAVAKYQSKRKAAEATNSSIDTVNKYISNLEQVLGIQLVVNSARGSYLTRRAEIIVAQVENVQLMLDSIYNQYHSDNKYGGNVCVCLPLVVSASLFPFGVTAVCEEYPEIRVVSITTLGSPDYRELGADFAIVTTPPADLSRDYSLLYQKNIECSFFATEEYLRKYGEPENIAELLEKHKLVNNLQNETYIAGWKEFSRKAKNIVFSSNSSVAVDGAVRGNLGVGLMPSKGKHPQLVCLEKLKSGLQMTVYLVVSRQTKDIPRVKIVSEYYKAALDRM